MRMRGLGAILVALAMLALPLSAQERFGGLSGVVTDTTKAPVPGATVTATNNQTGTVRTAVTGTDGAYRISELSAGPLHGHHRASGLPENQRRLMRLSCSARTFPSARS